MNEEKQSYYRAYYPVGKRTNIVKSLVCEKMLSKGGQSVRKLVTSARKNEKSMRIIMTTANNMLLLVVNDNPLTKAT